MNEETIDLPLYERLRPKDFKEFIGQTHLKQTIQTLLRAKTPPSILFFGPPGCGKTTLALLIAKKFSENPIHLSAPEIGLSQLKKHIKNNKILILDEIHRFSKTQQDFFLPVLEKGKLILFATTTENPSFSITKQLLSRLHVLKLSPLTPQELKTLATKAINSIELTISEDIIDFLIGISMGDARSLLNLIEYIKEIDDSDLSIQKIQSILPNIIQRGDRRGDTHYHLASALIKSIRGSDPNASVYYLACMLESGEDPRFICRRLIISASEDIGLADPYALTMAVSCAQAVEMIGMPEGFIPLSETVIYLSLAPKSNSTYSAYLKAKQEIKKNGIKQEPLHLRNIDTKLDKEWGYGKDYKYPHSFAKAWVEQQYLPDQIKHKKFYYPKTHGKEPYLISWLKERTTKKK